MIQAAYITAEQDQIQVTLDEGDSLGTVYGPAVFAVGMAEGNAEYDELQILLDHGLLTVSDFVPPTSGPPIIISDRQFFQQLAIDGVITQDEALATADGTMPGLLLAIIGQMPAETQFSALMLVKNATTFERYHPLTAVVGQALGWDDERLDTLWSDAGTL